MALKNQLFGWVKNTSSGVELMVNATDIKLDQFLNDIQRLAPGASLIESLITEERNPENFTDFRIIQSEKIQGEITLVSPDIAVCDDCLFDLRSQVHRLDYPFINCTNCGPRFSIIRRLPYDRPFTTMAPFTMCSTCHSEYANVLDRRFHAQPVACNSCGPEFLLVRNGKEITNFREILTQVVQTLEDGGIIAVKGIGGFHLMCNAENEAVVKRLRSSKLREGKPFAVLFRDLATLKKFAILKEDAEKVVTSWERPIIILPAIGILAPSVTNGFSTIGAMLPYTPFHHLLFNKTRLEALVLTSGNLSDEPIVIDNLKALETLGPMSDSCLVYNRDIYNRTDDSVFQLSGEVPRILRRSRGFAPFPVRVKRRVEGILAAGAELSNCFAVGRNDLVFLSQHIGDLKNFETHQFYLEAMERFKQLFEVNPHLIAADLHPDYLSTQYAISTGLPMVRVQHHHAHIASCMAENGVEDPVIGVAFDGTGLGDDGTIWGGEFMVCDFKTYKRYLSLPLIALPGGDKVTSEPWRIAVSILFQEFGNDFLKLKIPFLGKINSDRLHIVVSALEKNINVAQSSSAGRWFDAVASLTGICLETNFQAEAPMRLEDIAWHGIQESYPFEIKNDRIVLMGMVSAMVREILDGKPSGLVAARFQNTFVRLITEGCTYISQKTGIKEIALSGGTFQNRFLMEQVEKNLLERKFKVFSHRKIPTNDGGIALGQIMVAAAHR